VTLFHELGQVSIVEPGPLKLLRTDDTGVVVKVVFDAAKCPQFQML
jgi:hypothetical protein